MDVIHNILKRGNFFLNERVIKKSFVTILFVWFPWVLAKNQLYRGKHFLFHGNDASNVNRQSLTTCLDVGLDTIKCFHNEEVNDKHLTLFSSEKLDR